MTEHLDVELKWPVDGLDVVPAPEEVDGRADALGARARAAASSVVDRNLDDLFRATLSLRHLVDRHQADHPPDPGRSDLVARVERALVRLERAALDVSAELTAAGELLAPAPPASGAGGRHRRSTAVTWPPRVPGTRRRRSRASRERTRVMVPLLLVVALAGAAVGYKVVHHRDGTPPAAGNGLVVVGTTCRAGASLATVRVTSVRQADGGYVVGASGLVSNASAAPLHDVVVHWAVTYGDGRTVDGAATLTRGDAVAAHGLGGWVLPFIATAGPAPAATARVTGVTSRPARPACR
jgi:hypothetical protein